MEITFIKKPEYKVDFTHFLPEKKEESHRSTKEIALEIIQFLGIVLGSIWQGAALVMQHSYRSFAYLCLMPFKVSSFEDGALKIALWFVDFGYNSLYTAMTLVEKAYQENSEVFLQSYASSGMCLGHFKSKELKLDASGVPNEIQVNTLKDLLEKVNFTDSASPFYLSLGGKTKEELDKGLAAFIYRVENRIAFLGTPPEHDKVALEAFYKQIEDGIRLCLDKLQTAIDDFEKGNPDENSYNQEQKKQYRDLLENRARFVFDLAAGGKWCGARYMSEVMEAYYRIFDQNQAGETLEDSLHRILANKRLLIAKKQIQNNYGTDAHAYTLYMGRMGPILGLPGTENIIEHLTTSFDTAHALRRFFQEYDETCIMQTIQEELARSQPLREQVIDWLKDQGGNWALEGTTDDCLNRLKRMAVSTVEVPLEKQEEMKVLDALFKSDDYTKARNGLFWEDFVEKLFALPATKAFIEKEYPDTHTTKFHDLKRDLLSDDNWQNYQNYYVERKQFSSEILNQLMQQEGARQIIPNVSWSDLARELMVSQKARELVPAHRNRESYRSLLTEGSTGKAFKEMFEKNALDILPEEFLQKLEKVKQMRKILPLCEATYLRILDREADLSGSVEAYNQRENKGKFLEELNVGDLKENGLKAKLMEWVFVFNHIFVPKMEKKASNSKVQLDAAKIFNFNSKFIQFYKKNFPKGFTQPKEPIRFRFDSFTDQNYENWLLFEKCYREKPEEFSALAVGRDFYPKWREILLIHGSEKVAKVLSSKVVKAFIFIYVLRKAYQYMDTLKAKVRSFSEWAPDFLNEKSGIPGYQTANKISRWVNWHYLECEYYIRPILDRTQNLILITAIAQTILYLVPPLFRREPLIIPYWRIPSPLLSMGLIAYCFMSFFDGSDAPYSLVQWKLAVRAFSVMGTVSKAFQIVADRERMERSRQQKELSYAVWLQARQEATA